MKPDKNKGLLVLFCNQKDREDPRQNIEDRQRLQERVTVGGLKLSGPYTLKFFVKFFDVKLFDMNLIVCGII